MSVDEKNSMPEGLASSPLPEHGLKEPKGPKAGEKFTRDYLDALDRYFVRLTAINRLREEEQLSMNECIGKPAAVVRERQKRYSERLEELKRIWREEDELLEATKL